MAKRMKNMQVFMLKYLSNKPKLVFVKEDHLFIEVLFM